MNRPAHPEESVDSIQIDLTAIVAIWMGGAILLVPLLGLAARWGVVPLLDSLARLRSTGDPSSLEDVRRRLGGVERQIAQLSRAVDRLEESGAVPREFEVGR